jgi:hypothetical protein
MEVHRSGFPEISLDNDEVFLGYLKAIVEATDEYSSLEITKTPTKFNFRIAPSTSQYLEPLLKEILKLNNMFGIHLELSKSMKTCGSITFSIDIL